MSDNFQQSGCSRRLFGLICIYLFVIYANTFQVPFVWDDLYGVVERKDLQLNRLTPSRIFDTFTREGSIYRPISCLSLAVNYYIGGHHVPGYHLVNLFIHFITTLFLYNVVRLLLPLGKISLTTAQQLGVAGLTTILWAAHPMQTQAVTYTVQRMSSMAAMFYVCGLWAYLRWRRGTGMNNNFGGSIKWLFFALFAFLCGVLSKPNAALFPAGILLVECCFLGSKQKRRKYFFATVFGAVFVLLLFSGENLGGEAGSIFNGYQIRPFTLKERLLTQPRVLFFYVSQLLYPVSGRFSIDHYFSFSASLCSPGTTVWAILGVITAIGLSLILSRRYPLIGFPVLFYFVHHLVESSVFPLALAYEHRNYLPSLFFFLPLSLGAIKLLAFYKDRNRFLFFCLFVFITSVVFLLGMATHTRNHEWRSPKSLWKKAIQVSPEVIRPYAALGWYYTRPHSRNLEKALWYDNQGVKRAEYSFIFEKADLWQNIARIYIQKRAFAKAKTAAANSLDIYQHWLAKRPGLKDSDIFQNRIAGVYAMLAQICAHGDIQESLFYIDKSILLRNSPDYYRRRAQYLMLAGQYERALQTLQQLLSNFSQGSRDYLHLAQALTLSGYYQRGYWFYKQFLINNRQPDAISYLYLAENRYLAGDKMLGDQYVRTYIRLSDRRAIDWFIKRVSEENPDLVPFGNRKTILEKVRHHLCSWGAKMVNQDD